MTRCTPSLSHGYSVATARRFERFHLVFGIVAGKAVAFLHRSQQLVPLALDAIEVVVGQLSPLLFHASAKLLPLAFNGIPIHRLAP